MLTVVFLVALITVAATAASLNVLTDGKREKEKEMIWRGNQYVRAIKLYYRKNGRFPAQLEDLYKPKIGNVRFLRQPYKDPMNKTDGSWRLIYVGPAGQLIGSLKPQKSLQLPAPGTPTAPGAATSGAAAGANAPAAPGSSQSGTPAQGSGTGAAPPSGQAGSSDSSAPTSGQSGTPGAGDAAGSGQDLPPGNVDSPSVIGGAIIGIGSKIDGRSVIVCDKAKNYRLFEFVWDPSKDMGGCGQGVGTGGAGQPLLATPGGQPGQTNQPGQPGQPGQPAQPGTPPPNPNPPAPPPQQN
jgi:hypothetical protein